MAKEIGVYTPKQAKRIWDSVQAFERMGSTAPSTAIPYTPTPIYFVNKSTETIHGCRL